MSNSLEKEIIWLFDNYHDDRDRFTCQLEKLFKRDSFCQWDEAKNTVEGVCEDIVERACGECDYISPDCAITQEEIPEVLREELKSLLYKFDNPIITLGIIALLKEEYDISI